jgi:hypothetical protein
MLSISASRASTRTNCSTCLSSRAQLGIDSFVWRSLCRRAPQCGSGMRRELEIGSVCGAVGLFDLSLACGHDGDKEAVELPCWHEKISACWNRHYAKGAVT